MTKLTRDVYRCGDQLVVIDENCRVFACYPDRNLNEAGEDVPIVLPSNNEFVYVSTAEEYIARIGYIDLKTHKGVLDLWDASIAREARLFEIIDDQKAQIADALAAIKIYRESLQRITSPTNGKKIADETVPKDLNKVSWWSKIFG